MKTQNGIASALLRARSVGSTATLTDAEWETTLAHFDHRCAFCGLGWEVVSFAVFLQDGGGAVFGNSIPACRACVRARRGRTIPKWIASRAISDDQRERLRVVRTWARGLRTEPHRTADTRATGR
jgi:hypothetical protein